MKCKAIGCNKDIFPVELLKCIVCKCAFHFHCQNITSSHFMANSASIKKTWKCMPCCNVTMTTRPNVTTRSRHLKNKESFPSPSLLGAVSKPESVTNVLPVPVMETHTVLDEIKDKNTSILTSSPEKSSLDFSHHVFGDDDSTLNDTFKVNDLLSRSVEEVHFNDRQIIEDLKAELIEINSNLSSTQHEFENQLLENARLNEQIKTLTRQVNFLTRICQTPLPTNITSAKSLKKRHSIQPNSYYFASTPAKKIYRADCKFPRNLSEIKNLGA